jgi:hypothetical protein
MFLWQVQTTGILSCWSHALAILNSLSRELERSLIFGLCNQMATDTLSMFITSTQPTDLDYNGMVGGSHGDEILKALIDLRQLIDLASYRD